MGALQLDGTKIWCHIESLHQWKMGEPVYPILVEISPTNQCNHKCVFCAYEYLERRPAYYLDTEKLLGITSELSRLGTKSLFYSGEGEPLLHRNLPEIVGENAELGFDQALNTNGVLLRGERMRRVLPHLSWVRVSLNGGTNETHARIHGTVEEDFNRVIDNLIAAVDYKQEHKLTVTIGVQLVHVGQPEKEIFCLAGRVKEIGVDYFTVKNFNRHPAISFHKESSQGSKTGLEEIEKLSTDSFKAVIRHNLSHDSKRYYEKCLALPFFAEIISNGDVYSCGPHLGKSKFCYGNVFQDDFQTIWSRENLNRVAEHISDLGDLDKACMPNCRLHAVNNFLWDLASPPAHVNFI